MNAARSQLTWTHYRTLMRLPDEQRAFYERLTMTGGGVRASWTNRSTPCSTTARCCRASRRLYLNWFRENDKREGENAPIVLILCGSKNEQVVRLLLANPESSMDERIKVARYLLLDTAVPRWAFALSQCKKQG